MAGLPIVMNNHHAKGKTIEKTYTYKLWGKENGGENKMEKI